MWQAHPDIYDATTSAQEKQNLGEGNLDRNVIVIKVFKKNPCKTKPSKR